jgi:hypothetical protein
MTLPLKTLLILKSSRLVLFVLSFSFVLPLRNGELMALNHFHGFSDCHESAAGGLKVCEMFFVWNRRRFNRYG